MTAERPGLRTVVIFFLTLCLCFIPVYIIAHNHDKVEKLTMEQLISEKSARINDVMLRLLLRTETLSSNIRYHNGEIVEFPLVASILINDPAIVNILIAPDGVVSDVFPLAGNEAVLGLDFFSEGIGNKEAQLAMETGQLVMGGPFEGIQGGQLMVGRLPVYVPDPDGIEQFWGLVSVTLAYPQALYGAGLNDISILGFDYELWRINPDSGDMQMIAGSDHEYNKKLNYIEMPISILNAEWYFRILSDKAWYSYLETWAAIAASLCISLLFALVEQYAQRMKKLKHKHDQSVLEKHMVAMKLLVSSLEQQNQTDSRHRKSTALFRHDIKHFGNMLLYSIDRGDTESARKLIGDIDRNIRKIETSESFKEITGHKLIDAALHHCIELGKKTDIAVSINMQPVVGVSADLTEFAVTLANIMDNAVNACNEVPEDKKRGIIVSGCRKGEQYFVEVANTCAGEVAIDPDTELPLRPDGEHGFGSQSIAYFAQKYDASLQYKYHDNWFFVRLLI